MNAYAAPVDDLEFVLTEIAGLGDLAALPGYEEATPDLVGADPGGSGQARRRSDRAPLNHPGDRDRLGDTRTAWCARPRASPRPTASSSRAAGTRLPFDPDYGGQGLPWALASAVQEMWQAANMSFALCPLLTTGAVELLQAHGSAGAEGRPTCRS